MNSILTFTIKQFVRKLHAETISTEFKLYQRCCKYYFSSYYNLLHHYHVSHVVYSHPCSLSAVLEHRSQQLLRHTSLSSVVAVPSRCSAIPPVSACLSSYGTAVSWWNRRSWVMMAIQQLFNQLTWCARWHKRSVAAAWRQQPSSRSL